jgi:hypothetical protein
MQTFMLLMLLHLAAVNPFVHVHLTDVPTVEVALVQLNQAFPDWEANYKVNEFDCSEMSAFVDEYLDACGLNAEMKTGYNFREGYGHAWVVCQGKTIEATWLQVNTDKSFYDALTPCTMGPKVTANEYDWWNSPYMIDKMH